MKNSKPKILHVCETSGIGGAETVLFNIVTSLDSDRFDSLVVLLRTGWLYGRLRKADIPVIIINSSHSWPIDFGFIKQLLFLIRKQKVDLIHSHLPDINAYCCIAGFIAGVPVVTTYHGKIEFVPSSFKTYNLKLYVVRHLSARIVSVSNYLKHELCTVARFPQNKIVTIYNGIDFYRHISQIDDAVRKELLGIPEKNKVIGIIANLRPDKGYEYFIRAASIIHKVIPNTTFLIIGEERPDIKAMIEREISQTDLNDSILFLGFREDTAELLKIFNVFMLSSISEGLSIATIEAMFAGVPVVATKCGGPEEIITDGSNGFLVSPRDEKGLALKALIYLKNEKLAMVMAERARELVKRKFSLNEMSDRYQKLYLELLY